MFYNTSLNDRSSVLAADAVNFEPIALDVFRYQYANNELYGQYCQALRINTEDVTSLQQIPFMPVSFFKTHKVMTGSETATQLIFESSGTTGETPSRHYVADAGIYEKSLLQGFEQFYGNVSDYTILALLPSYLERKNASLVHMAKTLMERSASADNGYYINEWNKLKETMMRLEQGNRKVLLLGVTFALLDFAAAFPMALNNAIVMETGGMKGRREEMTRAEVHEILKTQWQLKQVHSEYGMTELLSQAYAKAEGVFSCASTMRVLVRDLNDPRDVTTAGTGGINVVDLANVHSCSFIETEDIGTLAPDGTFEVLGRMDNSALRGCSLMVV